MLTIFSVIYCSIFWLITWYIFWFLFIIKKYFSYLNIFNYQPFSYVWKNIIHYQKVYICWKNYMSTVYSVLKYANYLFSYVIFIQFYSVRCWCNIERENPKIRMNKFCGWFQQFQWKISANNVYICFNSHLIRIHTNTVKICKSF